MWTYLGPSCPARSFSTDLDNAEIDIRIRRILALRENRNYGPSSIPLRERIVISKVSPLELASARFVPISAFPNVCCAYAQGLGCVHSDPWGVTLPEDVVRREANRADNERQRARKQRRQLRSAAQASMRAHGEETPSESRSS
jgi:hypothetical protein